MRPLAIALGLAALSCACAARADTFSPGPLAKGHAAYEGLNNCSKCHPAGGRLSPERCLDCHTELKGLVARGLGYHGRLAKTEQRCETCHHDHQGEEFDMIDWGKEGQNRFDHAKTGWPLRGKHASTACQACHERRLLVSPEVKKLLAAHAGRKTLLGTATTCAGCHFDDHRGQEGADCKRCHDEKAWKPAPTFDHNSTAQALYPLEGAHKKVACEQCHRTQTDSSHANAFPAPVSAVFPLYKPIEHGACQDCHADPHKGRFGNGCTGCHSVASWKELHTAGGGRSADRRFHETTRYPLRGRHESTTCAACHGNGASARFKGIPFALCTDCHADAHRGQLARVEARVPDCTRCHSLDGFLPARFSLEEHALTRYPLLGAHQATPCVSCHERDPAKAAVAAPEALRPAHERRAMAPKVSPAVFLVLGDLHQCETCHKDVHGGQFDRSSGGGACVRCHVLEGFRTPGFDHASSRFPLEGKHATTACQSCHRAPTSAAPVLYRPLALDCASCHADAHEGQFGFDADCARCHDAKAWKPAPRFVHAEPFTRWMLDGKHATAACKVCHPEVEVVPGVRAVRYKPLPLQCEGCHVDQHDGVLARFSR